LELINSGISNLLDTPDHVSEMYIETLAGLDIYPFRELKAGYNEYNK